MLHAKLAFFKSLADDVKPFLREFQSDAPLVPFLHSALCQMLKHVLERSMKPKAIESVSSIFLKNVQTEANLLPAKNVVLGFDTLKALKKSILRLQKCFSFDKIVKISRNLFGK